MCRANHLRKAALVFSAAILFFVTLGWVMFAALLDDTRDVDAYLTHASPYARGRAQRHGSSRVRGALPVQHVRVEEEVMEFNLRRCDCSHDYKEANGSLGMCR